MIICDKPSVLNKWKGDIEKLFKNDDTGNNLDRKIRDCILNDSIYLKKIRMVDPLFEESTNFNRNIEMEEVRKAVMKANSHKAVSIDTIPNEVPKNDKSILILHKLFQLCLDTGIVPIMD